MSKMAAVFFFVVCVSVIIAVSESTCGISTGCTNKCFGSSINLAKLVAPQFTLNATAIDRKEYSFVFNLCDGANCDDVSNEHTAVCQWKLDHSKGFNLGLVSEATWSTSNQTSPVSFNVTYSGKSEGDGTLRTAVLEFVIGENKEPIITFIGETADQNIFHFKIEAKLISAGKNVAGPIGWALISLAILALVIYFIAGALLMYFVKGAHGIEIIPNYIFWKSFPFLVAEGCMFVISPCHSLYRRGSEYQKI